MKDRNQRWGLVVGGLGLSVLLPYLAMNLPLLKEPKALDLFSYTIGLGIAVAVALAVLLEVRSTEIRESVAAVWSAVHSLELRMLSGRDVKASLVDRDDFYRQMQQFAEEATIRIDLMYQASRRPEDFRPSDQKTRYISTLAEVAQKGKIPIRRLIRLTSGNKEWLKELVEQYSGKPTLSLSVLPESMVPNISVQLFDRQRIVLVNLSESDTRLGGRDVIFESAALSEVFQTYYEAVFRAADPLVENGRKHLANIGRLLA
jgi:hypothetical protein